MPKFAVIGLGRFGAQLAETLTQNGAEVIAIDHKHEIVEAIRDRVALAVRLDSTTSTRCARRAWIRLTQPSSASATTSNRLC